MTKTSTEDPSEVVRICSISFKSGEKFKKFEDKVHFENFSTLGANIC